MFKKNHESENVRESQVYGAHNNRRDYGGNDYFDYVDYTDYNNGVQGGDYLDELYVDENWDPNHVKSVEKDKLFTLIPGI